MGIIKNIFYSLVGLALIFCTVIFIFLQTFDADQYLPQITKKVSHALGRPVSIGHLGLGLSAQGITLDAAPLTIADDPNFTTEPFIEVDRVRISVDLRSLILQKEIDVTGILLQSPEIHFIRSLRGDINALSIAQPGGTGGSPANANAFAAEAKGPFKDTDIKRGSYWNIKFIKIEDAAISFIDQSSSMPLDIWLTNINASLNDVSLAKPFRLSFAASFYSNDPNVHGSALVSLDPSKRSVGISNLSLHTDLLHLDIEGLKDISPEIPDSAILKDITGSLQLNLAYMETGASGDFKTGGNMTIANGIIKDFNIVKIVLSHTLGVFGSMGDNIGKLGTDDTVIEKAAADFTFHNKTLFIGNSLLKTNILEFTAKGSLDQGFNVDMQTMLHLNAGVSADLAAQISAAKYLMDDSERIAIGASLKGVYPHLKYKPDKDFRKKSKKAFIAAGGSILGALLGGR